MTAFGNVPLQWLPCLLSPRHDQTDARTRRPDLDLRARGYSDVAGPTAFLQCGETGECIYLGRDGCTIAT
jgi:hypothetical protein